MLFNSFQFLIGFVPLTFVAFFLAARVSQRAAILTLAGASLSFYSFWDASYLWVLLSSLLTNYIFGTALCHSAGRWAESHRRLLLKIAVVTNLLWLAHYKYQTFILTSITALINGAPMPVSPSVAEIPLGISFFTFTQIAFLVDVFHRVSSMPGISNYALFVTYFPHLIAGPILHHKEMMPQFDAPAARRPDWTNLAVGLSIFFVGLFKKVLLADTAAIPADRVFNAASSGATIEAVDAWIGALAYTCQLYFDFSGYSDMAVGLSLIFNVRLPLNFYSPYKAVNVIEFWRRWHMTLSRFLRDYLYIPLGGNRHGTASRYANLAITMVLGGLWHGAGWTFVAWGGLHGAFLMINHGWRTWSSRGGRDRRLLKPLHAAASVVATFGCVVVAWVFFRANSMDSAFGILRGMFLFNGLAVAPEVRLHVTQLIDMAAIDHLFTAGPRLVTASDVRTIVLMLAIVWGLPNTYQLFSKWRPALIPDEIASEPLFRFRMSPAFAIGLACLAFASLTSLTKHSPFLYFQF